jgi:hypothetical protein
VVIVGKIEFHACRRIAPERADRGRHEDEWKEDRTFAVFAAAGAGFGRTADGAC